MALVENIGVQKKLLQSLTSDDEYLDREREEERMHRYEPMYERRISRY